MSNGSDLIPPSGTPGFRNSRNPTLLPNFDQNISSGSGDTLDHASPAAFLQANPRVNASATATIGGTVTTGDELTLVISSGLLGNEYFGLPTPDVAIEYTTVGGDTVGSIAAEFASLINSNAALQALGVSGSVAGAVLTINQAGEAANFTGLSTPNEAPVKITVGGTALTGDELTAVFTGDQLGAGVVVTFASTTGNTTTQGAAGLAAAITANATLAALGISATNTAAVVDLTIPAGAEPVNVAAFVNTIVPTATIGGTPAVGDVLNLTFTNAALPGGSRIVSVTLPVAPTTTTAAAALAAAITADPVLATAGISATNAAAVISIAYQPINGQIRFSQSVTGASTITLSATPTETAVVSTSATETITLSSSTLTGGSGPVIPYNNFTWSHGGSVQSFWIGQPRVLDYPTVQAMVADGMPIV